MPCTTASCCGDRLLRCSFHRTCAQIQAAGWQAKRVSPVCLPCMPLLRASSCLSEELDALYNRFLLRRQVAQVCHPLCTCCHMSTCCWRIDAQ